MRLITEFKKNGLTSLRLIEHQRAHNENNSNQHNVFD